MRVTGRAMAAHRVDDPVAQLDRCTLEARIEVFGILQAPPVVDRGAAVLPAQALSARELAHRAADRAAGWHVIEVQVMVDRFRRQFGIKRSTGKQEPHVARGTEGAAGAGRMADRPGLEGIGDDLELLSRHVPEHQHETAPALLDRGLPVLHPAVQHAAQVVAAGAGRHAHRPHLVVADVLPALALPLQPDMAAVGQSGLMLVHGQLRIDAGPARRGLAQQGRGRCRRGLIGGVDEQQEVTVD